MYQSVIEKTRGLAFRTQALGAAIGRVPGSQQAEVPQAQSQAQPVGQSQQQPALVDGAR